MKNKKDRIITYPTLQFIKKNILPVFFPLSANEKLFATNQKNVGSRSRKSLIINKCTNEMPGPGKAQA